MVMAVQMLKKLVDADSDGIVDGTSIAADGTVTGSDGYSFPMDSDNNGIESFRSVIQVVCLEDIDGTA